ncbi:hypothetical protein CTEN210_07129 [Chaetoceros tenuissimus]|uniref:Integrase catalytic domain-containing protein n=1 Tax=Chaetoceros tenuissimus TaxID=426638 RepID=A0AAD3CRP2_9STRA|nr:hypothetical protein CTEN210_07129 [Chaetoceros tenuissimus]
MTIVTDTVALRAILEVPVCNVTTTGGYSSVQVEKTRVSEITIPKLVNSSDNKSWLEKVEETLVMHSLSNYFDVKDKIGTNKTLSHALVLKLLNALENSPYSYLQMHKRKVKDFCDVWSIIKNALTDKSAIYTETMKDWNMLFQNSTTNREEFLDYLNVFITNRDKLITEDADTLQKLVSKGSSNETISDVLEELKDLFTPLPDEIAQSGTKLAAHRTPGAVHFDNQPIPKKQKILPPPPKPKLPVDVGKIIPPHFYSRFAQWFKIMSQCSDPAKWTAEQKKSMHAIKEELEGHASKLKEFKDMNKKCQKQGEQLKTTRHRLETLEKSSGLDQNPRWEEEQPTGGFLQSHHGPTSNPHDQYNPMGRGRGRGYNDNRYFDIGGALNSMQSDTCLEVVNDAYTKMIFDGGTEVIGIFHQGLLDLDEKRRSVSEPTVEDWRANLGFPSVEVTKQTLRITTQLLKTMEMEMREYMQDFKQSQTTVLKPYRIKDVLYTDTFFSTIKSVHGHTCFQMFVLKRSMYTKSVPMKAEQFVYNAYRDFIVNVGAPVATVSDNARVFTSAQWKEINRTYLIQTRFTIAYHQSSNFAELIGGKQKYALVKLFHYTPHAPYEYWCYGLEFLDLFSIHLSRQGLQNKTSHLFGDTEDISIFRFPWFCPVWFYAPTLDFPVDRMKPGFFLGIATNIGDGFSYIIIEGETIVKMKYENGVELPDDNHSEEDLFNTYTTSEVDMIEVEDPESDFNQLQHDNPNPLFPLADPDNDGEMDEAIINDTPPLVLNTSSDSEYSSDEDDDDEDDEEDDNNKNANPTVTPAVAPASPVYSQRRHNHLDQLL